MSEQKLSRDELLVMYLEVAFALPASVRRLSKPKLDALYAALGGTAPINFGGRMNAESAMNVMKHLEKKARRSSYGR